MLEEPRAADLLPPGRAVGHAERQELALPEVGPQVGVAGPLEGEAQPVHRARGAAAVAAPLDLAREGVVEAREGRLDPLGRGDPEDEVRRRAGHLVEPEDVVEEAGSEAPQGVVVRREDRVARDDRVRELASEGALARVGAEREPPERRHRLVPAPEHAVVGPERERRAHGLVVLVGDEAVARELGVLGHEPREDGQEAREDVALLARHPHHVGVAAEVGERPGVDEDGIDVPRRHVEHAARRHEDGVGRRLGAAGEGLGLAVHLRAPEPIAEGDARGVRAEQGVLQDAPGELREGVPPGRRERLAGAVAEVEHLLERARPGRRRERHDGPLGARGRAHAVAPAACWKVSLQPRSSAFGSRPRSRK